VSRDSSVKANVQLDRGSKWDATCFVKGFDECWSELEQERGEHKAGHLFIYGREF